MRFLKNTFNFTRSWAFAQNAKFYALKMLKKQNLTHPKAAKLATLNVNPISYVSYGENSMFMPDLKEYEVRYVILQWKNTSAGWDNLPTSLGKK